MGDKAGDRHDRLLGSPCKDETAPVLSAEERRELPYQVEEDSASRLSYSVNFLATGTKILRQIPCIDCQGKGGNHCNELTKSLELMDRPPLVPLVSKTTSPILTNKCHSSLESRANRKYHGIILAVRNLAEPFRGIITHHRITVGMPTSAESTVRKSQVYIGSCQTC